jgi:RNA polymerase sigma-70 factor (ECF subfamily)
VVSTDDLAEVLEARDDARGTREAHFDVARAMRRLRPRERALLWLAYVQGLSHEEIASALGLRTASLKALLWRARRRLLEMVKGDDVSTRGRS